MEQPGCTVQEFSQKTPTKVFQGFERHDSVIILMYILNMSVFPWLVNSALKEESLEAGLISSTNFLKADLISGWLHLQQSASAKCWTGLRIRELIEDLPISRLWLFIGNYSPLSEAISHQVYTKWTWGGGSDAPATEGGKVFFVW